MADIKTVLAGVCKGLAELINSCGLEPVDKSGEIKDDNGKCAVEYKGEGKALRFEYFNKKISVSAAVKEDGEIIDSDYRQYDSWLLDPETATDKDIRSAVNEFNETITGIFGTKTAKPIKSKLPTPVSKAAAKSGSVSYDPNTLGNRFTSVFPELREEYKSNCEKYGQFLPEDFFLNHGNAVVLDVIRENNPVKMKKLFNLLNDIYEDGTNETQSIIAVTILGSMNNDQQLLANCVDYMCEDMTSPVIQVNKYLESSKSAKMRLENPPKYKPKRAKKKSRVMSNLGM